MTDGLLKRPARSGWVQLFRYFWVGGTAFAVDFGLLWLLTGWCGVHYLLSAAIAFAAGLTVNYALSVSWVFSERALRSRIAEFTAFVSIGIVGLGLNEAILWSMTDFLELHYLISKTVATAAVFFWNFTARKYLLFNGKNRE